MPTLLIWAGTKSPRLFSSSSLCDNPRSHLFTDDAAVHQRKGSYFPDRLLHGLFANDRFRPLGKSRPTLQVNVSNLRDANGVVYVVRSANCTPRYAP